MTTSTSTSTNTAGLVEDNHINVVPEDERHGRPRDQFTLWFAANANVVNFVLGGLAIAFGLNLFWAIVAVLIGNTLGLLLTSLHAWQGPRLGVPQMIQSRGQFGFSGANFILLASIFLDVGYLASQQALQGQAMHDLVGGLPIPVWIVIVTLPAVALAIFGYRWIHQLQKVLTVVFAVVIVVTLIQVISYGSVQHQYAGTHLSSMATFIATVGLYFMNMLSWSPYVSDYSRYLPADISFPRTFWAIFLGNFISTSLFSILGAWITSVVPVASSDPLAAISTVSGSWVLFFMALSQLPGDTLNAYTGMMAVAAMGSDNAAMMSDRARQLVRVSGIMILFVIGTALALLGYKSFLTTFENFINILLFFFVPWSAINLVDFYLVRHGNYDVQSFFNPRGRYGHFMWRGCLCYVLTLAIQVPFLAQTEYTGPLVKHLGGADISWAVGFVFAAVVYFALAHVGRQEAGVQPSLDPLTTIEAAGMDTTVGT